MGQIFERIEKASQAGKLAGFLTNPDPGWKTLGDAKLQVDFYERLKINIPTLHSHGLSKAKEFALCNPTLAKLSDDCNMDRWVNVWANTNSSSHSGEGKKADAVEALYYYLSRPESGLQDIANLIICELVCQTIVKLRQPPHSERADKDDKADTAPSPTRSREALPSAPSPSSPSSHTLPAWVKDQKTEKLHEALQQVQAKNKDLLSQLTCVPVQKPDTPTHEPTWYCEVSAPNYGSCQYEFTGPKSRSAILAKMTWLLQQKPEVYQELQNKIQ